MINTVEIQNLKKKYGRKTAVDLELLTLEEGTVNGLFGPNGSGKTTLIKILSGMILRYKGDVYIQGEKPGVKTKSFVSYLPDRNFLGNQNNIKESLKLFNHFYKDFSMEKAKKLLENMQLEEKMKISSLSKGMEEKLNLALVLSRDAKLFLLDEPIAGVDPVAREQILSAVISNIDPESTMLVTTHIIKEMEGIFDRALFINEGKIVLDGNAEDLRIERKASLDEIYRREFGGEEIE